MKSQILKAAKKDRLPPELADNIEIADAIFVVAFTEWWIDNADKIRETAAQAVKNVFKDYSAKSGKKVSKSFTDDEALGLVMGIIAKHGADEDLHDQSDHNPHKRSEKHTAAAQAGIGDIKSKQVGFDFFNPTGAQLKAVELGSRQLSQSIAQADSTDALVMGLGSIVHAHVDGQIGADEFGRLSASVIKEYERLSKKTGVGKAVDGLELMAGYTENAGLAKKADLLRSTINLFGEQKTQNALNIIRDNLTTGGKISDDDLAGMERPQTFFAPARNANTRMDAIGDWFSERRGKGGLRAKLGLSSANMGFVIDDNGDVLAGYRGREDDVQTPFSIRGIFKGRDKHVIRGRDRGTFTNSDIFWGVLAPPKQLTINSGEGENTIQFSQSFRDAGLMERWGMWRSYRGYQKKLEKQGINVDDKTRIGILSIMRDDFPRSYQLKGEGVIAIRDDDRTPRVKLRDELKQQGFLPLSQEEAFARDPAYERVARIRNDELELVQRHLGESLNEEQLGKWQKVVEEITAEDELARMIMNVGGSGGGGGATSGRVTGASATRATLEAPIERTLKAKVRQPPPNFGAPEERNRT